MRSVVQAVAGETKQDPVEALCISSHGETFVPVDDHLQPLGPAILNIDNRAVEQTNWLTTRLGLETIFEITGLTPHPMYPVPKILWLRENQKALYKAAAKFLGLIDYLLTRLGLPPSIDYSLASRFLAFDIRRHCWSDRILSVCDLTPDQFAKPVPAGTIAGALAPAIASELGLRAGTPVIVGGHDQPCTALACAVTEKGSACASLGTYECLVTASETPPRQEIALPANLNTSCHIVPDRFVTLAYFPAGIMMEWFVRLLHPGRGPEGTTSEDYSSLESHVHAQPTGLCILPHLIGTCNPDFNPHATGVICGLRPETSRYDIYRGILEGIACEFSSMTGLLQSAAGAFASMSVTGGGCRSRLGLQLRASLSGKQLQLMQSPDAVCLGSAILSSVAIGKFASFQQATQAMAKVVQRIDPDPALAAAYELQVEQYRCLYGSLSPVREAQAAIHLQGG